MHFSSPTSHVLYELDSLFYGSSELWHHCLEPLLLVVRQGAEAVDLRDTLRPELHLGGEEGDLSDGGLDVGALDDVGDPVESPEAGVGEEGPRVGHGEGGGPLAGLGLDDLRAAVLGALRERVDLLGREGDGRGGLGEEGEDGDARVAAHHWNVHGVHVEALLLGVKGLGAHDVQGRHAEEFPRVVHAVLLKDLRRDGNGGVHRVGDHGDDGFGAVLGACFH
mmetsp:Transcript_6101/g.15519  ORF Transcript_6101/g.15519 Transcript_6101/m.15519 type:complete len:222 (-) Transcript_6101:423-1088(-)